MQQSIKINIKLQPRLTLTCEEETELRAKLTEARAADEALNGPVYHKDSLHACGFRSPSCESCRQILWYQFLLGERDHPFLTTEELDHLRELAAGMEVYYCQQAYPEAEINNWASEGHSWRRPRRKRRRI